MDNQYLCVNKGSFQCFVSEWKELDDFSDRSINVAVSGLLSGDKECF